VVHNCFLSDGLIHTPTLEIESIKQSKMRMDRKKRDPILISLIQKDILKEGEKVTVSYMQKEFVGHLSNGNIFDVTDDVPEGSTKGSVGIHPNYLYECYEDDEGKLKTKRWFTSPSSWVKCLTNGKASSGWVKIHARGKNLDYYRSLLPVSKKRSRDKEETQDEEEEEEEDARIRTKRAVVEIPDTSTEKQDYVAEFSNVTKIMDELTEGLIGTKHLDLSEWLSVKSIDDFYKLFNTKQEFIRVIQLYWLMFKKEKRINAIDFINKLD
jgi:hypothetical protein